jgi:predicted PurR-regulated permease PerM
VTPLVVFYLLVDWHPMLNKVDGWLPRDHAPAVRRLAGEINDAVAAFIRGQGTVCLILAVFYAAALSFAGLKYGLLVGVATGILSFVPFVGWALGLITATGLAVVQFWPDVMSIALVMGVFLAGQALDAGYLSPQIVGSKIGLHPVWLIFALFVFSYLFGFIGVLVAVPVAAAVGVLARFALEQYLASPFYKGGKPGGLA